MAAGDDRGKRVTESWRNGRRRLQQTRFSRHCGAVTRFVPGREKHQRA